MTAALDERLDTTALGRSATIESQRDRLDRRQSQYDPLQTVTVCRSGRSQTCLHNPPHLRQAPRYSVKVRKRSAFTMTDTELSDIARAAMMGLSRRPKAG
jgi:hypothetical protein